MQFRLAPHLLCAAAALIAPPLRAEVVLCAGTLCGEPPYESPRVVALELAGLRANVLLPPGYDSSDRHYPVLYLLNGGAGNENTWLTNTDLEAFTANVPAAKQAIVVTPDGGPGSVWADWDNGYYLRETWFFETLIPYVDTNFRSIADRSQRAIAGLSGGGYGAMHFTARHPSLFVAAGSLSGALDIASVEGHLVAAAAATLQYVCDGQIARADPFGDNGDLVTREVFIRNHNPIDLVASFRGASLYVTAATGVPCEGALLRDLQCMVAPIAPRPLGFVPLSHAEPLARAQASQFHDALTKAGIAHTYDVDQCGLHTYPYFERSLHAFWQYMHSVFGSPPPPAFDYRTADERFDVWGWSFETDPARSAEFLDVSNASCAGVGITGSGTITVTTAPCFAPGETIALRGAVEPFATADEEGSIRFHLDLGPPHEYQQYTLPARLLEVAGGYFTSRTVAFTGP
jgi:S-formylglutathione hydrolase FrmB